jgi:glycogen debranching enzyme
MEERASAKPAFVARGEGSAPEFYIPATSSPQEERPRILKQGETFGVFNHGGDIVPGPGSSEGLFHRDTRHLSRFELRINGAHPLVLGSTVQDDNGLLTVDLTNPDRYRGARLILSRDTLHILRLRFLWRGACYERLVLRNFDNRRRRVRLSFRFACDFADIFEVRGHRRARRGRATVETTADTATFTYEGLDGILRRTVLHFDPLPHRLEGNRAVFETWIEPGERFYLFPTIACDEASPPPGERRVYMVRFRQAQRHLRAVGSQATAVQTSNAIFNEVLCRSVSDLYMLISQTPHGPYPYAGIPWFSTEFGRDGVITALQALWIDPGIARGVLATLAATQAREIDPETEAEPGKILHETRRGEMANLGEVPFGRYYGSVDATPLFVLLAGMYFERTGDLSTIAGLWPNIEAALKWIDTYGDADGDGFVEYRRQSGDGLVNQGWKDSNDSVFHADGALATGPIALCEVQAYVYAAKRHAAVMARELGQAAAAATLEHQAQELRERFEEAFWCEELSTYALALDGDKRPCRVRASNAGHALFAGIADPERAARVADTLLGHDFFSGWGIRTVARGEPRYNPMSYHNGSVWPHDNALISLGLARYGLTGHALRLFKGMFEAATYMDLRRLPELFCGFHRRLGKGPTLYPVACAPQAWAAVTPFAFLAACMGLEFDLRADEIRFRHPRLPEFLNEVRLRGLRLGQTHTDIVMHRAAAEAAVSVLHRSGEGRVVTIL